MKTWMEVHPDRFAFEVAELERLGFQVLQDVLASARVLAAHGQVPSPDGAPVELTIVYPDASPFLRPEVFANGLLLDRHQHPYMHNLCLLDHSTLAWEVHYTGGMLITEQVPKVLDLVAQGGEALRAGEVPQGEPWLSYLPFTPGAVVFVPQAALAIGAEHHRGEMTLGFGPGDSPAKVVRALLGEVSVAGGRHGQVIARADSPLADRYAASSIKCRWVRLPAAPIDGTAAGMLAAAIAENSALAQPRWRRVDDVRLDVIGCLVEEEVSQGTCAPSWAFIVRVRRATGARGHQTGVYLARGERYSTQDLCARTPTLEGLREKTVLVVGTGGLGAPIALELARCGIRKLILIDGDHVDAGNTVRWPLGMPAVGWQKADALTGWIQQNYPYTDVGRIPAKLGQVVIPSALQTTRDMTELDVLGDAIAEADVIVDATAEVGIQHLLSSLAGDTPQVHVWATEGAAGGVVARIRPGTGCWVCLQHHITDKTVLPSAIPGSTLQPRGCAHLTFTGTSFDLATVSNQAVRVTIAQLLDRSPAEQGLSVCSLRDADDWAPAPIWQVRPLEIHPRCQQCSGDHGA